MLGILKAHETNANANAYANAPPYASCTSGSLPIKVLDYRDSAGISWEISGSSEELELAGDTLLFVLSVAFEIRGWCCSDIR